MQQAAAMHSNALAWQLVPCWFATSFLWAAQHRYKQQCTCCGYL